MGMSSSDNDQEIMERHARLEQLRDLGIVEDESNMSEDQRALYEAHLLKKYQPRRRE